MKRGLAAISILLATTVSPLSAQEIVPQSVVSNPLWVAGSYSFSDELGGFTIRSVSGTGTRDDPVVVVQELNSASPVTMVIRTIGPVKLFALSDEFATGIIHMRMETINGSGVPWLEFEFELQEVLRQPSVYGDGLSFDQRRTDSGSINSDRFSRFQDNFEPYDRLLYFDGWVNPSESATFSFLITDFTPQAEFYLLQDPRIPAS